MTTIQTTLHHYRFDLTDAAQAAAYDNLLDTTLTKIGFPVWAIDCRFNLAEHAKTTDNFLATIKSANGKVIELETDHLFPNQWNAKEPSLRLFNWAEYRWPNAHIKEGYWLEQTPEMAEVLRNTHKCGYCGHMEPAAKGHVFCPQCLGSERLQKKDLCLTRMVAVRDTNNSRARLTQAEEAHLVPLWREAQIHGKTERDKVRIAKQRKDIEADYAKACRIAEVEYKGKTWLMDNGINIDLAIYYSYRDIWTFGWSSKLDKELCEDLLKILDAFPFNYEVLCNDGTVFTKQ